MIDTLRGLTIPEGEVVKIEAGGVVIWALQSESNESIVLEVEKITSDTYAAETTYTDEQFILLDIYPKTNGTVKVTYGGLTKTITDTSGAEEPNAIQVFFGTFNGVADEVATPASGELIIEGDYRAFGIGEFNTAKTIQDYCDCITSVNSWGDVDIIPSNAFRDSDKISINEIPEGIIGIYDFAFCEIDIEELTLPTTLQILDNSAFTYYFSETGGDSFYIWKPNITTILATTPPVLNTDTDVRLLDAPLFIVPKGCGEAYKTDENWISLASYIYEEGAYTFAVDGVQYEMEIGMTWQEWVNSSFNIDGFEIYDIGVKKNSKYVANKSGITVNRSDYIYPSETYTLKE